MQLLSGDVNVSLPTHSERQQNGSFGNGAGCSRNHQDGKEQELHSNGYRNKQPADICLFYCGCCRCGSLLTSQHQWKYSCFTSLKRICLVWDWLRNTIQYSRVKSPGGTLTFHGKSMCKRIHPAQCVCCERCARQVYTYFKVSLSRVVFKCEGAIDLAITVMVFSKCSKEIYLLTTQKASANPSLINRILYCCIIHTDTHSLYIHIYIYIFFRKNNIYIFFQE